MNDWPIDDDSPETDETAVPTTPAPAPAVKETAKPQMFADPKRPSLVLPNPVQPGLMAAVQTKPPVEFIDDHPDADPLPSNYMACLPILKRLQGMLMTVQTRSLAADLRARIAAVSIHVNRLTNEAPAVDVNQNTVRLARGKYIGSAQQRRNESITELKAAIAADVWLPISPAKGTAKPLIDFLETDAGKRAVTALRPALAGYQVGLVENFIWFSPHMRREEHRLTLSAPSCTDEVANQITDEAILLGSEHFNTIATNKRVRLQGRYEQTVKPRLLDLLRAATAYVNGLKASAKATEAAFFADAGVPPHETAVSKQFDTLLLRLQQATDRVDDPFRGRPPAPVLPGHHDLPSPESELLTIFGLGVLPDAAQ